MRKILVTGASGLLGSRLVDVLSEECEVTPTHNISSLHHNSLEMNVVDRDAVSQVFKMVHPDVVVHTAAMTNVDKCETDRESAWNINALGTKNVAQECGAVGAKLIYVSTDYVFDGVKGRYCEDNQRNPINYYGYTKMKGEDHVKEFCEDFVIARTSVIYGWHPTKLNFVTWIIESLKRREKTFIAEDHYNSPTFADDLAEMIRAIIENDLTGIYHTAGNERISRYMFALKVARVFELDSSLIAPVKMNDLKGWIAKRPRDSSLSIEKLKRKLGFMQADLDEALERMNRSQKLK